MIKIVSGFTGPGGSTVVFNTLVNLFNTNGMPARLYGNYKWEGITCDYLPLGKAQFTPKDTLIYHFINVGRMPVRKQILSCHETHIFEIRNIKNLEYDAIHYVSQFQKTWQGVEGVVIPNPIRKFSPRTNDGSKKVAGIIGSIDHNKRTHLSIERALKDKHKDIRIYGAITDPGYFNAMVKPLLSDKVTHQGVVADMGDVYNKLTHVYHSPLIETFNLIKPECMATGVTYIGNEGHDTKAEYWPNERILEAWKNLLN